MKDKFIKAQQEKLTLGAIDRRQFMTSVSAAGIAIPTALSLAGDAIAATPKKGGKFRMGLGHGSTTDTLDSGTSENHFTLVNGSTFGNHLTEIISGQRSFRKRSFRSQFWIRFGTPKGIPN